MTPLFLSCLCYGAALMLCNPPPTYRLIPPETQEQDRPAHPDTIARDIELFCQALEAGLHPALAAKVTAGCSPIAAWMQVAYLIECGATQPWNCLPSGYEALGRLMSHSHYSGIRITESCHRIIADLRTQQKHALEEEGNKSLVLIALPLGLCFLPAFIILGLIPVIISMI